MPKVAKKMDAEMTAFAADVLESIKQAKRGEAAHTHTASNIAQYKTRGRPVGTVKDDAKQAVTVRYSPDVRGCEGARCLPACPGEAGWVFANASRCFANANYQLQMQSCKCKYILANANWFVV